MLDFGRFAGEEQFVAPQDNVDMQHVAGTQVAIAGAKEVASFFVISNANATFRHLVFQESAGKSAGQKP